MRRMISADVFLFLIGGALVFGVLAEGVPRFAARGVDPFVAWMMLSAAFVFTPIVIGGVWLWRREGAGAAAVERLRLGRLSKQDWRWAAAGLIGVAAGGAAMKAVADSFGLPVSPFSRAPRAWDAWWIFAIWAVYWPLNILGEEFTWRAVILPRMQCRFGDRAWAVNAVLWAVFHAGFGIGNILVVGPTLILVPLLAQRRQNTWLGVILHAGVSLPGMIAIATGRV